MSETLSQCPTSEDDTWTIRRTHAQEVQFAAEQAAFEQFQREQRDGLRRAAAEFERQERQRLLWSADPFTDTLLPFATYLEPEGYAALRAMKSRVTKSYQRHVPRTYALAEALHQSLPQKSVWGQQARARGAKAPWRTVTAGKWIEGKRKDGTIYRFPEETMSLLDVLKALTDPDAHAVGNKDASSGPNALVRHVRIDIDMDRTFREDALDFHLADLVAEIRLVRRVYAAFGLTAHIFRTGNRGIQAVAPIPPTDRREASLLTECVRTVLAGTRLHLTRATDFQTSLDGLMRLPLGRHGLTDSLALFLGDDGLILPPDQQVESTLAAFCHVPDMDMDWAEETRLLLTLRLAPYQAVKADRFRQIVSEMPDIALIKTFHSACQEFQVRDWEEVCTHTTPVLLGNIKGMRDGSHTEASIPITADAVTNSEDGQGKPPRKTSTWKSPNKLKEIGRAILDGEFEAGSSYHYYMNTNGGKNAIGWALVVHEGDQQAAEGELVDQAERVGGTVEAVNDRIGLIKRLIPKNDTYERFQQRAKMFKHRALDGDVLEAKTYLAKEFVTALVEKRRTSPQGIKAFQPKALIVIRHIIELVQLAVRISEDGLVRVSTGTLAAQITHRWPEAVVGKSGVVKLLRWITAGDENCLVDALRVVYRPKRVTEPTVYELGPGITDLIP